jgi:hypothetical protein
MKFFLNYILCDLFHKSQNIIASEKQFMIKVPKQISFKVYHSRQSKDNPE